MQCFKANTPLSSREVGIVWVSELRVEANEILKLSTNETTQSIFSVLLSGEKIVKIKDRSIPP